MAFLAVAVAAELAGPQALAAGPAGAPPSGARAGAPPSQARAGATAPGARTVAVSPAPGERFATPQTTISFRGVTPAALGTVRVTGSRSGVHPGTLVADPAGYAIWKPRTPFIPGERVTVHSAVAVTGAAGDSFSFTVARIASHAPEVLPPSSGTGPTATVSRSAAESGAVSPQVAPKCKLTLRSFRSEPSLTPPGDCVNQAASRTAPGDLFVTPAGTGKRGNGAAILDNQGHLVWYDPVNAQFVHNLQRLTYKGQPVLAFYQGKSRNGFGDGEFVMMNEHYQVVAYIRAGDGDEADLHELTITPQNTALLGAYVPVKMNLTKEGGTASQVVYNYVVQEIDVATGNVLFSWDSLDHVPVTDSEFPVPAKGAPFDYFHGNSISLTSDGNLLISGRNVSALYDVNRTTGAVIWVLGGRHSSFTLKPAGSLPFCYQHYARQPKPNVITVFDDGGSGPASCPNHASRALTLTLNTTRHTATISRSLSHNPPLHASFLGTNESLPNGDTLVSWGNLKEITEFNSAGRSNFDMSLSGESYRAIRAPWTGTPFYPPAIATHKARGNKVTVYASWNGDTQVASWRILAGSSPSSLRRVGQPKHKSGFQTQITVTTGATWLAARALSSSGKILATSPAVRANHTPSGSGYYLGTQAGNVYNFDAPFHGSLAASGKKPASRLVGTVVSPGGGYYLPSSGGNVYTYGAKFFGSPAMSGVKLSTPVVGMGTNQGTGYYLATSGGNVYNFGKAPFDGSPQSAGRTLTSAVAGIAVDPKGGYWLVERDGGVLNFGAPWFGSERGKALPAPVVGIAAEPNGDGYLLVTAKGNVFNFGRAPFNGSPASSVVHLASPVVGIATQEVAKAFPQPTGYYVVSANGDVYNFGIALPGSPDGLPLPAQIDGVGAR